MEGRSRDGSSLSNANPAYKEWPRDSNLGLHSFPTLPQQCQGEISAVGLKWPSLGFLISCPRMEGGKASQRGLWRVWQEINFSVWGRQAVWKAGVPPSSPCWLPALTVTVTLAGHFGLPKSMVLLCTRLCSKYTEGAGWRLDRQM